METINVDILSWLRMSPDKFGCMLETTFGYRDERFNCSLKGYKNNGDPCIDYKEYYEGPEFPQNLVKKVHPHLESIGLFWEGGMLQHLWLSFDNKPTQAQICADFGIDPNRNYKNIMSIDADNGSLSIQGFDHTGAGDINCEENINYWISELIKDKNVKKARYLIEKAYELKADYLESETPLPLEFARELENKEMEKLVLEYLKKNYKYKVDKSWLGKYTYVTPEMEGGQMMVPSSYELLITPDSCVFSGNGFQLYFVDKCTVKEENSNVLTVRLYYIVDGMFQNYYKSPYRVKLFRKNGKYYFNSPVIDVGGKANVDVECEM
jgi:hypothetical protein